VGLSSALARYPTESRKEKFLLACSRCLPWATRRRQAMSFIFAVFAFLRGLCV